jgi:hypothetical protein
MFPNTIVFDAPIPARKCAAQREETTPVFGGSPEMRNTADTRCFARIPCKDVILPITNEKRQRM